MGNAQASFVSRGGNSGTGALERRLWKSCNLHPDQASPWYKDIGGGKKLFHPEADPKP